MKYSFLLVAVISFFSLSAQIESGSVANLKFNGNVQDVSTSNLNTLNSSVTFVTDRNGNFENFGSVIIPDNSKIKVDLPLTVSTWIKINDLSNPTIVFIITIMVTGQMLQLMVKYQ